MRSHRLLLAKELGGDVSGLKIVHSPFSRTVETAQCVIAQLNAAAEVPLQANCLHTEPAVQCIQAENIYFLFCWRL